MYPPPPVTRIGLFLFIDHFLSRRYILNKMGQIKQIFSKSRYGLCEQGQSPCSQKPYSDFDENLFYSPHFIEKIQNLS